jgi:hypothetical protein
MDSVSIAELAKMCGRSVRTVRRWRQGGRIRPLSQMLPDRFGVETLAALGLVKPADTETGEQRRKRASRVLFKGVR